MSNISILHLWTNTNVNSKWSDLNKDGRRLEGTIKRLNTEFCKTKDPHLMISFSEAVVRTTKAKVEIARIVLGVDKILKEAEKEDSNV